MTHFILKIVIILLYINFSVEGGNKTSYFPPGNSIQHTQNLKISPIDNLPLENGSYLDTSLGNSPTRPQGSLKSHPNNPNSDDNVSYLVPNGLILEGNRSPNSEPRKNPLPNLEDDNSVVEGENLSNRSVIYPILNNWGSLNSKQRKRVSSKTKRSNFPQDNLLKEEETPMNSTMDSNNIKIELSPNHPRSDSDPGENKLPNLSQRYFALETSSRNSSKVYHRIPNSTKNDLVPGALGNSKLENKKAPTLLHSESLTQDEELSTTLPSDFAVKNSMSSQLVTPFLQVLKSPTEHEIYNTNVQKVLSNSPESDQVEGKSQSRLPKVFLLKSTTATKTTLTTVTRTVLNTCYSTHVSAAAPNDFSIGPCNGRKRRKRFLNTFPTDAKRTENEPEIALDSTLSDLHEENGEAGNRNQRVLTFWSTSRTTITVTTKSFLTGTTATVTVQCTIPNVITSPFCGFIHFD